MLMIADYLVVIGLSACCIAWLAGLYGVGSQRSE